MPTAAEYLADAAWKKRWGDIFGVFDANKNGVVSQADILIVVERFRANAKCDAAKLDTLKAALLEYAAALGVSNSDTKLDQSTFVQNAAALCAVEGAKLQKGEQTILHKVNNASFDVVDSSQDGYLSWDEFQLIGKAWNTEAVARIAFDKADKNKDGKLSRKEFIDSDARYFCGVGEQNKKFGDNF